MKACSALTPTEKLVWLELYGLDHGPDGAFIGAGHLAARLGFSREVTEGYRRRLLAKGLLYREPRGRGKTDRWFPLLPPQCCPSARRLTTDQVALYAERLDYALAPAQSGVPAPTTQLAQATAGLSPLWYAPTRHSIEPALAQSGVRPAGGSSTTVGGEVGEVGKVGEHRNQVSTNEAEDGPRENAQPDADAEPVPAWRTAELSEPEAWPEPPEDENTDEEAQRPDEQVADTPEPFEDRYGL